MSISDLTISFANTSLRTSLTFEPQKDSKITEGLNAVPALLFRVFDEQSDGITNSWRVESKALSNQVGPGTAVDIFAWEVKAQAAATIRSHLKWQGCSLSDNLVSWTASLPFALKYIFYRHNHNGTALHRIKLSVLQTRHFQARTFVRDMVLMQSFREHDEELDNLYRLRQKKYYFAEYLSQGQLDIRGCCTIVTGQQLVEAGLFVVYPELEAFRSTKLWANDVLALRQLYDSSVHSRPSVTDEELVATTAIINLFGEGFRPSMAIWFLALRARRPTDEGLLDYLRIIHSDKQATSSPARLDDTPQPTVWSGPGIDQVTSLPEIKSFCQIARTIRTYQQLRCASGLMDNAMVSLQDAEFELGGSIASLSQVPDSLMTLQGQLKGKMEELATILLRVGDLCSAAQ